MSRSEAEILEKNEASLSGFEAIDEPGPVIVPIHRAERTFRWLSGFRNEPRFELAPVSNDGDEPDRAA
jgi:hypothetical protein